MFESKINANVNVDDSGGSGGGGYSQEIDNYPIIEILGTSEAIPVFSGEVNIPNPIDIPFIPKPVIIGESPKTSGEVIIPDVPKQVITEVTPVIPKPQETVIETLTNSTKEPKYNWLLWIVGGLLIRKLLK